MKYRRLGTTGMKVSAVSLGAWLTHGSKRVDESVSHKVFAAALDHGINFIDVADIYARGGAEEVLGHFLTGHNRQSLVISTKAYFQMSDDVNDQGLSRKHIVQSVENSLRRLGTDYIDIFFCHRYDTETNTEETVRAFEDLIRAGKILYWGTSMWTGANLDEAVSAADKYNAYRPVVEQPLYNMLDRDGVEGKIESSINNHGIGLVVYSPLANGVLTGKYNDGIPEDSRAAKIEWMREEALAEHRLEKARGISKLADEMGITPAELALAWALAHPNVDSVITGATKVSHIESNVKALEVEITPDVEEKIEAILQNRPHHSQRHIANPDDMPAL